MMGRVILVAILIIQSCSSSISQTASSSETPHVAPGITLVDNGYSGILIALADSVKQDSMLIERLQELVNEASAALFEATDNRVYFKNVTILVPHNWKFPKSKASTTESLYKANIRVENPTSAYGNNPWTRQLGACGEPGEYMMLTPEYITSYRNKMIGSAAKTLVHEWGHLRWGLFDEYPIGDDIKDHFYRSMTNGEIEPTRCSRDVRGHTKNRVTGEQCKIDPVRQVPEADCRFYENDDQTTAQASLMFSTSLSSVTKFCGDEETGGGTLHNYQAPTAQNLKCLGRSSWSIMKEHSDFNNNSQPINSGTVNTDVTFKFVQKKKSRIVIGMDTSGSMNKNRTFVKLHAAVTMYLNFTVAKGAQIGLVKYNNTGYNVTDGLITIDGQDDRKRLMDRIPMERRGGSAIGKGLKCAIDMLAADGADTRGSRVILYTDGEENGSPTVQDVMPEAIAKGITVDTILITQNASNSLKNLAMQTGGVSFYVSGNRYSTSLLDAFTAIERSRTDDPKTVPVTIHSDVYSVDDNNELCREVLVDNNLGRDTLFLFSWSHYHNNLSISISNSTGSRFAHITDYDITSAALKCAGLCDTGIWEVCILNNRNHTEDVEVQVESRPRYKNASNKTQYPIALSTRIVNSEPDFANNYNDPVWLFATVTRGNNAVVGAKVVAHLEYPDVEAYTNITLEMRDDGFGADITEEDGTYSAYIINAETIGKHSIFVEVEGVTDTKVKTVTSYSRSPESKGVSSEQKMEMEATDKFQRYSLVGYIDVKSVIPEHKDMYPPERIIDLEITSTSFTNRSVTLEWTSVGDDLDVGKAKSYVVWRANNHRGMYLERKTEGTRVETSEIKRGSLVSPKEAYNREKIVVTVPDPDTPQLFAIVVFDHDNNPSRLSNIVTARLKPSKANDDGQKDVKMIIGFTIGFGVPLLILIVLVILFATGLIRGQKKLEVSGKYLDHRNTAYSDCS